jgi:hypothetical protein
MGGDVELSYPVLGPDDFVVTALKSQVKLHQDRQKIDTERASAPALVQAVFKANKVDPALAKTRVRNSSVARCRALVAWIWVELFGWPQVEVVEEIGVRPCTVSVMMSRLRREGLSRKETLLVNRIARSFSEDQGKMSKGNKKLPVSQSRKRKATVLVLRRNRKKR